MDRNWLRLTFQQLGRYGELLVASELLSYNLDVYEEELDDRGINLVVRLHEDLYYTIQVKTSRNTKSADPIYIRRDPTRLEEKRWIAFVHCVQDKFPAIYLFPIVENGNINPILTEKNFKMMGPSYEFTSPKVIKHPEYLFDTSIHLMCPSSKSTSIQAT